MTAMSRLCRSLALSAFGLVSLSGASAQSWDLDNCVMAGGCTSGTATVGISGWYATSSVGAFAAGTLNTGGTAPGGWTGVRSKDTAGNLESTSSPHHAIDNVSGTGLGASYEAVHLSFSKAVDLSSIAATWAHGGAGTGDFQLWRWNNSSVNPLAISSYNPSAMTGWTSVTAQDFGAGYSKTFNDGAFFSSHWLVTTAFGQSNDAFKLGVVGGSVCSATNHTGTANSGGICNTTTTNTVPEPASMVLVVLAAVGASVARRRRQDA